MSEHGAHIDVTIRRGTGASGWFQTYRVPRQENQTVLDVVSWIQQYADPTLSYRFACRVGMCGSCSMMVNGQPRWTCRTHVSKVLQSNSVRIEPIRNLPVINDLVTDMDPFFDKWVRAGGVHHPTRTRKDAIEAIDPGSAARVEIDARIECINCGVCYAACDTVAANPGFLGPAALQRAWTLVNDPKDGARQQILDAVSGKGGCHNCHSMGNCTRYCPTDLNPLAAIAGLKRETVRSLWGKRKNA